MGRARAFPEAMQCEAHLQNNPRVRKREIRLDMANQEADSEVRESKWKNVLAQQLTVAAIRNARPAGMRC